VPIDKNLTQPAIERVIADANRQNVSTALADHIAKHSRLTQPEALALTESTGATADAADASKVSTAASAAAGAASGALEADVELSDPVMLWPGARAAFAGVLAAIIVLCVILTYVLATSTTTTTVSGNNTTSTPVATSSWEFVAFAVAAAFSLIGVLVLVMGYKNVSIKGGSGSSGSGSSDSGSSGNGAGGK